MSVAGLSNQIRLTSRMIKRDLSSDPATNDELVFKLAGYLDDAGTQSILDLSYYENQAQNLSFFYDMRTGHVFTSELVNYATYNPSVNGSNVLVRFNTHDGREQDTIYCFFTKDGYPVFWNASMDNGSTWADVRGGLIFIGSVVLSVVGVPIAANIGTAVVGAEMAAAYPALAQGVGQVIINTLMNGGDIERAAVSAVGSFAGASVGAEVLSSTGSDVLSQASAAATRAYISGGDINTAVAQTLLRNGVTSMQSLLLSGIDDGLPDVTYDPGAYDPGVFDTPDLSAGVTPMSENYYTDENGITYGLDAQGDLTVIDYVDDAGIGYYTDAQGDVMVADAPTTADLSQTDSNGTVTYDASTGQTGGFGANVLSQLATTALSLVGAYVKAGAPPIRAGTANATVNANGTVTTRNPNGTVSVTRPAPGTPYVSASGSVVTNNGDGTYTTISPNGTIQTLPYSKTAGNLTGGGLMSGNAPLYLGLAAVAVLALSRR